MHIDRRRFLKDTVLASGALLTTGPSIGLNRSKLRKIPLGDHPLKVVFFHTNDLCGHPIQEGALGRAGLWLDSGNFLGTDQHERTIDAMNTAGYHAASLGPRELALGDGRLEDLCRRMDFPLVSGHKEAWNRYVRPSTTVRYGKYTIGITGAGDSTRAVAAELRRKGCDFVVCLSMLGFRPGSLQLAAASSDIDLILVGNDPMPLPSPYIARNMEGREVVLSGCAPRGRRMHELSFLLDEAGRKIQFDTRSYCEG